MSRFPVMRHAVARTALDGAMAPAGINGNKRLGERATRRGGGAGREEMSRLDVAAVMEQQLAAAQPGGSALDSTKAEAAYVSYKTVFADRLNAMQAEHIYDRVATVVETDDLLDVQVWLTRNPKMRLWEGDKVLSKYRVESHPVRTRPREASVEVAKKDIKNDRLGMYKKRIEGLADAFPLALDELAIVMIAAGIQGTALGTTYDGQNLIDTDHTSLSVGGTAQSNKVTGALSSTTYNQAWTKLLSIVDENGQPVNLAGKRMKLVVGPANREVARDIINQQTQANGETNMDMATADLIVTPWIRAGTVIVEGVSVTLTGLEWFLIPEGSQAVIIQVKEKPEFLAVEEGTLAFIQGTYLYGIEAEFGAAYGLWQEIVGGPGA